MSQDSLLMQLRKLLQSVENPETGKNIVAEGRIDGLTVIDGMVRFAFIADGLTPPQATALIEKAQALLSQQPDIKGVSAVATAHRAQASAAPTAEREQNAHKNPMGLSKPRNGPDNNGMAAVKKVIAVASGKGGVGKSTVAFNLALSLVKAGYKTGILDADIYGPSLPTLLGMNTQPKMHNNMIVPHTVHGLTVMSIGFLVDQEKALAWRGPMVMGALRQMMNDVDWGDLDIMIIDTPPGTGDVHLSLGQSKVLDGAIIVSTPQEMALADMRRGVGLFQRTDIPVLGIIENMAYFEDPTGARHYLFGEGGAQDAAQALEVPFLGALPIDQSLRQSCDNGTPYVHAYPESSIAEHFQMIAKQIVEKLD